MPFDMPKCKVTVLKRTINRDLAEEYLEDVSDFGPCERFTDGQEIIVEHPFRMPEGFCPWAWADIRGDILMIAVGGDLFSAATILGVWLISGSLDLLVRGTIFLWSVVLLVFGIGIAEVVTGSWYYE